VVLAQHSDQVLNAILSMAGREDFVLVGKVEDLRRKVFELALESLLSKIPAADRLAVVGHLPKCGEHRDVLQFEIS
jgi:hypothetical protein